MKLTKYKLGEILDVTRGASLSGEFYATEGKYIRLTCGNFDYQNNCFKENKSKDNLYYVGDFKSDFLMEEGDIITPLTEQAIGLLGSTAIIPESGKYIQSQDVAKIICKEELLDKDFAFYLISSTLVKQQLSAAAQQTKIRHTSPDKIRDCTVWIPELAEQKRIGKLLRSLDRKIELNRAINQNLEAMAKQLYDYWFVQFDFPNKDGKPYKSSGGEMVWNEKLKRMIPKEWTNANIYQLASISKETVNPQAQPNELFKHYSLPEYDKTGTYAEEYGIDIQSAKFIVTNNCILVSKLNPWTSRVICGNRGSNQICSTEFVVWNPASLKTKGFLFMLAKSAKFIEYCTQGATGTSHSHRRINPELMMKFDFPYNSEIAIKFSLLIENIIVHLHNNIAQLKVLTEQRDELLPLLMNGQITIE
ncbi:restriction endonuclease subunit S [Paraprevotella clara]|uniref:restriction endonuclease subunit S n=1 Tax=Paraprevotella clara TaxID=454154 RepID=UPI0022E1AED1|nr:restriction endonuclease subunit S [Paraprevotella clara]